MYFADALTLDTGRPVTGGFMAYRAKAARVGHYEYTGRDVDPDNKYGFRDQAIVKVARYSEDVHDATSAHSFIGKPITDDHPRDAVTRDNWRDHARGTVMGAKWEEGGYLAFDLMLTDGTAIDKVAAGKRELSNGYSCDLVHGDFTAADGVACQFKQTNIRGNHVALVDKGRAGPECAIRDAAQCVSASASFLDSLPNLTTDGDRPVKTILVDGLTVDMANADTAIATVTTLRDARDAAKAALATAEAKAVTDAAAIVTKDAEIAKLTADKAALEAAKPTPAQLRDAAKAYGIVVAKGKAAGITVTDAMGEDEIKRAVVDKMMPGNTYTADHIGIAFDALTKDAKVDATDSTIVPILTPTITIDADKSRTAFVDRLQNAWKPAAAA